MLMPSLDLSGCALDRPSTSTPFSSTDSKNRTFRASLSSKIEPTFVAAMDDYATDRRGDIGLYVRLAAIESYRDVLEAALAQTARASEVTTTTTTGDDDDASAFGVTRAHLATFVCATLKQSVEKIDRVRTVAAMQLHQFVCNALVAEAAPALRPVVQRILLATAADSDDALRDFGHLARVFHAVPAAFDWAQPSAAFDLVVPNLAQCPTFCRSIVDGLAASAGCLTPHVANSALEAMVRATRVDREGAAPPNASPTKGTETATAAAAAAAGPAIARGILAAFAKYQASERMAVPTLVMAGRALDAGVVSDRDLLSGAVRQAVEALSRFAKDIQRTLALVPVLASLARRCIKPVATATTTGECAIESGGDGDGDGAATFEPLRLHAWGALIALLASRFPKVRALASVELFTVLSAIPDGAPFVRASSSSSSSGGDDDASATPPLLLARADIGRVQHTLSATQWDVVPAADLKATRAELFVALRVPEPTQMLSDLDAAGAGASKAKKAVSELSLYKTLVAEKGF